MKITKTLLPGQPGTKTLADKYGERLICVRYRDDLKNNKRIKTIELIIEEKKIAAGKKSSPKIAKLKVAYGEIEIGVMIREAGGFWNKEEGYWELPMDIAKRMGLQDRILKT